MRTGWIEERPGKRGVSYRARYWVAGPDGEPVAKSTSFRVADYPGKAVAKAAAEHHLAEVRVDTARGTFVAPSEMTVRALVDQWLAGRIGSVRPPTLTAQRHWASHLPSDLGARSAQSVTALHVQAAFGRLREAGRSAATRAGLHVVLTAAFARAVEWGIVPRSPMRGVPRPDYRPLATVPWTEAHVGRFLAATEDHRFGALWRLALLTGMRRGEIGALRWSDVDLPGATLRIERTLTADDRRRTIVGAAPKTDRSRRTVLLPATCVVALIRIRDEQRARRRAALSWTIAHGDLVFDRGAGDLLPYTAVDVALRAEIRRLGVPPLSMHGMRHTCATILMLRGAHPSAVADILGDSVATVMRVYAHVTVDHRRAALDDLERAVTLDTDRPPSTTTRVVSAG